MLSFVRKQTVKSKMVRIQCACKSFFQFDMECEMINFLLEVIGNSVTPD